ncbi:hypothetical protein SAMN04515618_11278 [Collimonas sp. OK307]|nr:hypothetical protein SAMN04515618_11278 [Collimonas sp. OK307]
MQQRSQDRAELSNRQSLAASECYQKLVIFAPDFSMHSLLSQLYSLYQIIYSARFNQLQALVPTPEKLIALVHYGKTIEFCCPGKKTRP